MTEIYAVAHLTKPPGKVLIVRLQLRPAHPMERFVYEFNSVATDPQEILSHFFMQLYTKNTPPPHEILVPQETLNIEETEAFLQQFHPVHIYTPQRGKGRALLQLAQDNLQAVLKQKNSDQTDDIQTLAELQKLLNLPKSLTTVSVVDTSHACGSHYIGVWVCFYEGREKKEHYRSFYLRPHQDDCSAIYETVFRGIKLLQTRQEPFPDLLIIDGGRLQWKAALEALKQADLKIPLIAIEKEHGNHSKKLLSELIYFSETEKPWSFSNDTPLLLLIQKFRNEAHRRAIHLLRKARQKQTAHSCLDAVKGIGTQKKKILLKHFGSITSLKLATIEEIAQIPGISSSDAIKISTHLQNLQNMQPS